jgi:DNA sulfur modification protein DndE
MNDLRDHQIRITEKGKDHLMKIKRHTRLPHWNEICRWAFCRSLAEQTPPAEIRLSGDSNVEMSWRVFSGSESESYLALLRLRCRSEGKALSSSSLGVELRLHIHRGLGYLASGRLISNITGLCAFSALPTTLDTQPPRQDSQSSSASSSSVSISKSSAMSSSSSSSSDSTTP